MRTDWIGGPPRALVRTLVLYGLMVSFTLDRESEDRRRSQGWRRRRWHVRAKTRTYIYPAPSLCQLSLPVKRSERPLLSSNRQRCSYPDKLCFHSSYEYFAHTKKEREGKGRIIIRIDIYKFFSILSHNIYLLTAKKIFFSSIHFTKNYSINNNDRQMSYYHK